MAKPATGAIVEKRTARGTSYALRFRAYGQRRYVRLGTGRDAPESGLSSGRGGFRTCDLSRVKQRGARALHAFMPGNQPNRMPRMVIGSSPIRPGTAAFGPTIGPTVESASCRLRVVCSVNALAAIESVNREFGLVPIGPVGTTTRSPSAGPGSSIPSSLDGMGRRCRRAER
jgi:hypothetical protein